MAQLTYQFDDLPICQNLLPIRSRGLRGQSPL